MQAWNVYQNGKLIDTVFYEKHLDAAYVCGTLIHHDHYPHNISVRRAR
jgi:hypothetical protein